MTYIVYIARTFWPAKLAVYYPYSHDLPVWRAVAAGVALAGITVLVLRWFRPHPYLAVGWFWYLGTLVPVIGFVQVGGQSSADRYTYLPMVGLDHHAELGGGGLSQAVSTRQDRGRRLGGRRLFGLPGAYLAPVAILGQ